MPTTIDLTGSEQEIEVILAWAKERPEIDQISEPTSLDASRPMNVGLPEVQELLGFITVVFSTATAALTFLKALREELKKRKGVVSVSDSMDGKPLGRLQGETSDLEVNQMVPE